MSENHCRHYVGGLLLKCAVGVDISKEFDESTPGIFKRIPCYKPNGIDSCEKREWLTDDEIEEERASLERALIRMKAKLPLIEDMKRRYCGRSASEDFPCPLDDCDGTLTISIAATNGHTRGRCSGSCGSAWME